jgi:hypothetical protein
MAMPFSSLSTYVLYRCTGRKNIAAYGFRGTTYR